MSPWRQQLATYLILISLGANVFFAVQLYNRENHLNWITWGNQVDDVWRSIDQAGVHRPNGEFYVPMPAAAYAALETLETLRSLPHYGERVDPEDMQTLEHYLRYAGQAYAAAAKEQADTGRFSPRTEERLAKLQKGTEMIIRHQARTNALKNSKYPWNHAGWRAVWHSIATELRAIEFVPLDE